MKMIRQNVVFKKTSVDEENFIIRGIFSTAKEDRHGEIIVQEGWKLEQFKNNPVILFVHDHYQPAVAQCIELSVTGSGADAVLEGAIQFAAKEYDFAMTLFKLYAGGFMRAFSVGFQNSIYEIDQENDVVWLKENILHEISCVNVPAAADALAEQKGIDMDPVRRIMTKAARPESERKAEAEKPAATKLEMEDEAVKILSGADKEKLTSAIRALTDALNDGSEPDTAKAEGQVKVEHPARAGGNKKVSVKLINRAIKELLKAKRK